VDGLRMIECLKRTGMSLKDIRQFMQWCHEGDSTLRERRDMFYERREAVESQIEELRSTLDTIEYKCWFYDTAVAAGTDSAPREMVAAGDMPPRISKAHDRMMAR
jgi:DNA-binding transcriptional MerR regulator